MRQYFNPFFYLNNKTMEYLADFRVQGDFVQSATPSNSYSVAKNDINFYMNKWIEFSSLNIIKNPFMTFFSTAFESYTVYTNR